MFITFEGGEGSGKTTQIELLSEYLISKSHKVYLTREPGGTEGAENIRKLLVTGNPEKWDAKTEALLMYASRLDNYERLIKPNLNKGYIVISDRFADSTRVYQGLVGGISEIEIEELHSFCLGNFDPDLTFVLDIDVEQGLLRANSRNNNENRFESKGFEFHDLVRKGYLKLANKYKRMHVIDATMSVKEINSNIVQIIETYLNENNK